MEEDTHAPHRSRYARAWHQTWKIGCNTLLIQFFRYWYIIVFINPSRNDSILFPNIVFSPFLCQRKHFITDAFEDFIAKLHHVSPCHSVQEALLPIWASQKTFLSPNDPSIHHNDHHHLLSWISWQLITLRMQLSLTIRGITCPVEVLLKDKDKDHPAGWQSV